MTLSPTDRQRVEELVAALEDQGARIESVDVDRTFRDDPIEFIIRGSL